MKKTINTGWKLENPAPCLHLCVACLPKNSRRMKLAWLRNKDRSKVFDELVEVNSFEDRRRPDIKNRSARATRLTQCCEIISPVRRTIIVPPKGLKTVGSAVYQINDMAAD